jgi:hypothetical protein
MTTESTSSQAKLLARYLREKGLATLTHSQALEAIAHSQNLKAYNVLAAKETKLNEPAAAESEAARRDRALALLRQAMDAGLTFGEVVPAFAATRTPLELLYAQTAKDTLGDEGELEFDDEAMVSLSDDKGAYVMSWSWISLTDIPLPENPWLAFLMNFESINLEIGDDFYDKVPFTDLEVNAAPLGRALAGEILAMDTWIVRSKSQDPKSSFALTVEHLKALEYDAKGECYGGTFQGKNLYLEFHAD